VSKGQLRIYLGAAPGVGKTYAMLGEAHRRRSRGADVVIAVVESHGRQHTAELIDDLEVIPRRHVVYRGATLTDMDVDAVLARQPQVALVDELAHTNAPGSRNQKRWQDVHELLDAGIDVLSTVNVQHLESLNDVVQGITGVVQQETVPDEVVRRAEQVELVDITPEALRRRLSHGNVYRAEQVDAAMGNYFRPGNLTALREIALLWVADQVDTALAKYRNDHAIRDTWEARERTVVSVTGGPESETLIRRAKRIASRLGGDLAVVHVVRGDGVAGVSDTDMTRIRRLAEGMGATMHTVVGDDVPAALLEFARGLNATQLVLGTSRRSRWARIFDEGVGASVIRDSGPIDVHLVTHDEANNRRARPVSSGNSRRRHLLSWAVAVVAPALATLLLIRLQQVTSLGSQGALYFVVVLGVALFGGVGPAVLAAMLSGGFLNFFFTEPRYSLAIAHPENLITLMVLMLVAVAVAVLVDTAARRARDARTASREAELLALFASHVLRGADLPALLNRVCETYGQQSASLLKRDDGSGDLVPACSVGPHAPESDRDADTSCDVADGSFVLVLRGPALTARDRRVLRAVTYQAVGLLRQTELAAEADRARTVSEGDQLRRALLSAVSHDLRTPLASIKAGISALRSTDVQFSPKDTAELLAGVEEAADHLTTLVDNLLDSSRLAAGVVQPRTEPVTCEEAVYRALAGLGAEARVTVETPAGSTDELLPTVLADPGLLERVLANVLSNAIRYAPNGPIRVSAQQRGGRVDIRISDSGPGLPRGAAEHIFEPFQRLGDHDTTTGVGLGLTVAKGFTEAMGGTITAEDTPGGGLTMIIELPSAAPPTSPTGPVSATPTPEPATASASA
jgi:two-component system sensor histidine kinase KdpD